MVDITDKKIPGQFPEAGAELIMTLSIHLLKIIDPLLQQTIDVD